MIEKKDYIEKFNNIKEHFLCSGDLSILWKIEDIVFKDKVEKKFDKAEFSLLFNASRNLKYCIEFAKYYLNLSSKKNVKKLTNKKPEYFENIDRYDTQSKTVITATLSVRNHGALLGNLSPEKYFHRSYKQPVTEVAIRSTIIEDLYVILIDWDKDGTATFKVLLNPLVGWIWIGGGVLVLGGLFSFWPDVRKPSAPRQARTRRKQT